MKSLSLRKRYRKFKKTCFFTKNRITYIDYKDVETLKRFISKSGEILPRFVTGTKTSKQRKLALAIRRARFLALL
ncbi:MAG: 30S ribosomal protein S18 [Mollicutes bacterium]|nr:MAG: 30S ribosomal protein S18 [Mollicutes bacterium]